MKQFSRHIHTHWNYISAGCCSFTPAVCEAFQRLLTHLPPWGNGSLSLWPGQSWGQEGRGIEFPPLPALYESARGRDSQWVFHSQKGGENEGRTHTHTHTPGNSGWRFTLQMESVCSYYKWRLHVNVSPPAIFRNSSPVALYTWNKINTDCHKSGPHAFDRKCIIHIVQIRDGSRWSFC